MKNQTLFLVAGALLTSTALSTAASAATFTSAVAAGDPIEAYDPLALAIEVLPEEDADDVTISGFATNVAIELDADITDNFVMALRPTGATFNAISTSVSLFATDAGSSLTAFSASACTTTRGDNLIVMDCTLDVSAGTSQVSVIALNGLVLDGAGDLATAGAEVTINGALTVNDFTFDSLDAEVLLTSASAVAVDAEASDDASIDADSDPQFALINNATTATIAEVDISITDAVSTDLGVIDTEAEAFDDTDFVLAHDILTQDAVVSVEFGGETVDAEDFEDGEATISVPLASLEDDHELVINFDGETPIEEADAGTFTFTLGSGTELAGGVGYTETEVATAGFVRGGLNVSLNYLLASGGGFSSYARITNTGTDAAPVTITLIDAATGEQLGDSFETDDVEPDATLQLSAAEIEEGAGVTVDAAAVPLYNATITGALVGYVQHILFNDTTQFASDLSGFRSSGLVEQ